MFLSEAHQGRSGLLPHLHADQELRYPNAVVANEAGDAELWENDSLERRRVARGKGPRAGPKRALELDDPRKPTKACRLE